MRELLGHVELVGGENYRLPGDGEFADQTLYGFGGLDVEAQGGFVEEQQRRLVDQADGDGQLLLHAPGELLGENAALMAQLEALEQLLAAPARRLGAEPLEHAEILQVLQRRQPPVDVTVALEHRPQLAQRPGVAVRIAPADAHRTGVGTHQAGDHLDGRRLSGAVGPQESQNLAALHPQADPVYRLDRFAAGAKGLAQVVGLKDYHIDLRLHVL